MSNELQKRNESLPGVYQSTTGEGLRDTLLNGKSNPLRGAHNEKAVAFASRFPLGSRLSQEKFDTWAVDAGYLKPLREGEENDKQSDAWKARLTRRNELRKQINLAAKHDRLTHAGLVPFEVRAVPPGKHAGGHWVYEVMSVSDIILQNDIAQKMDKLATTLRRQLVYTLEAADVSQMDPYVLREVSDRLDDIDDFLASTGLMSSQLERKVNKTLGSLPSPKMLDE